MSDSDDSYHPPDGSPARTRRRVSAPETRSAPLKLKVGQVKIARGRASDGKTQLTLTQTMRMYKVKQELDEVQHLGVRHKRRIIDPDEDDVEEIPRPPPRRAPSPDIIRGPPAPAAWAVPHIRQLILSYAPLSTLTAVIRTHREAFLDGVRELYAEVDLQGVWAKSTSYVGYSADLSRRLIYHDATRRITTRKLAEDKAYITTLLADYRRATTLTDGQRTLHFDRALMDRGVTTARYTSVVKCSANDTRHATALNAAQPIKSFPPGWQLERRVRLQVLRVTNPMTVAVALAAGVTVLTSWAAALGPFAFPLETLWVEVPLRYDSLCDRVEELAGAPRLAELHVTLAEADAVTVPDHLLAAAAKAHIREVEIDSTPEFPATLRLDQILASRTMAVALRKISSVAFDIVPMTPEQVTAIIDLVASGEPPWRALPGVSMLERIRVGIDINRPTTGAPIPTTDVLYPPLSILADWMDALTGGNEHAVCEIVIASEVYAAAAAKAAADAAAFAGFAPPVQQDPGREGERMTVALRQEMRLIRARRAAGAGRKGWKKRGW